MDFTKDVNFWIRLKAFIEPEETRYFKIKATGASIDMENAVHVATIQKSGGNTIDHVFEMIKQ